MKGQLARGTAGDKEGCTEIGLHLKTVEGPEMRMCFPHVSSGSFRRKEGSVIWRNKGQVIWRDNRLRKGVEGATESRGLSKESAMSRNRRTPSRKETVDRLASVCWPRPEGTDVGYS